MMALALLLLHYNYLPCSALQNTLRLPVLAGQSTVGSTVYALHWGHYSDTDKQQIPGHFSNNISFQIDNIWVSETENSRSRPNLVNTEDVGGLWPSPAPSIRSQCVPCEWLHHHEKVGRTSPPPLFFKAVLIFQNNVFILLSCNRSSVHIARFRRENAQVKLFLEHF